MSDGATVFSALCTQCGACCRRADLHNTLKDVELLPLRSDGSCLHLIEVGDIYGCAIYEIRPESCRVGYTTIPGMSEEKLIELTAEVCNQLQQADDMPQRFRVNVGKHPAEPPDASRP